MYCEIVDCDSILTGRCQCWFNGQDWNIENLDGVSKNLAFVQKCYTPKAILLPFDDHNFGRIPATGDFRYWVAPSRDTEMSFGSMAQGVDGDWMAEMWLRELGTNDNKRKKNGYRFGQTDKPQRFHVSEHSTNAYLKMMLKMKGMCNPCHYQSSQCFFAIMFPITSIMSIIITVIINPTSGTLW